jgi:hypothetical protein
MLARNISVTRSMGWILAASYQTYLAPYRCFFALNLRMAISFALLQQPAGGRRGNALRLFSLLGCSSSTVRRAYDEKPYHLGAEQANGGRRRRRRCVPSLRCLLRLSRAYRARIKALAFSLRSLYQPFSYLRRGAACHIRLLIVSSTGRVTVGAECRMMAEKISRRRCVRVVLRVLNI